jgi:hypothetical protein
VAMRNCNNGIEGYQVNVLIPKGTDLRTGNPIFQTMPVTNFDNLSGANKTYTTNFPNNLKYVQDYMDYYFQDDDHAKEFYQRHGIPYATKPIAQQQETQQ